MSAPVRIQLSRKKGFRLPPGTVVVARPSTWGNPYKVSAAQDAAECVRKYRAYVLARPEWIAAAKLHLRGKNLACWCPLGAPCHGEFLLELANKEGVQP